MTPSRYPPLALDRLPDLFEQWLASKPGRSRRPADGALSASSAQLYRDMWAVFVTHLVTRAGQGAHPGRVDLDALGVIALQQFLQEGHGDPQGQTRWSDRYAWRMLHLIDRVLNHHLLCLEAPPYRAAADLIAQPPYCHANAAHHDGPTEILDDAEVERLTAHLLQPAAHWKAKRDRAAVATMLGAGLGPADVQALTLDGVAVVDGPHTGIPWRLTVPADGLAPRHQTPLLPWAGEVLARWLAERTARTIPGHVVFPSTQKGSALTRMSCHRMVVGVLAEAGLPARIPLRLRHTFAVRQLSLGHDEEAVGRWLGLVESKAMRRYVALAMPPATAARRAFP